MAVGARDELDIALVKKYASLKVDNPIQVSMIDAGKMYEAMNDYASTQKAMILMKNKLYSTCTKATAMAIQYNKTKPLTPRAQMC